jgi:hypothetical protein
VFGDTKVLAVKVPRQLEAVLHNEPVVGNAVLAVPVELKQFVTAFVDLKLKA